MFLSWYLLSLDKISSFVEQLFRPYRWFSRYVIAAMLVDENKRFLISSFCSSTSNICGIILAMRSIFMFLWCYFFLLLSLLVSVVSFQLGAMLACHNYWHWAVYHIEKVRTLSLLYHPNFRKHQTTLEHCRRHSDNIGAFLRKMFRWIATVVNWRDFRPSN